MYEDLHNAISKDAIEAKNELETIKVIHPSLFQLNCQTIACALDFQHFKIYFGRKYCNSKGILYFLHYFASYA